MPRLSAVGIFGLQAGEDVKTKEVVGLINLSGVLLVRAQQF